MGRKEKMKSQKREIQINQPNKRTGIWTKENRQKGVEEKENVEGEVIEEMTE